ncbi:MAG: endopeptidase La [Flavobacteriaceae bacterium]|jgi:ATP-dependent Lon protease|nr:endopeptidase La [Flavobacteriaceae bacterium]MBT3754346.1 endopeptidase La [Flavobacteriaceae bacterium]MBT3794659.1 endopeptidase La [Flavobacteriaceae bacterium]MBT4063514.1 endopeptidase La [Flavobacteriaceae bacterium]MBT4246779.1 endopeptidase La [Flavobacteriaceae bacterium]
MSKTKLLNLDMMSLQNIDEDSDLIPLMTSDDEEAISKESLPDTLPILPLKNTVMFPGVVIPITASRDKSIKLIKDSNTKEKLIGVVSQKDSKVQMPTLNDIHSTGTVAKILRVLQMPDGNVTVIIQGKKRFSIEKVLTEDPFITAQIKEINEVKPEKDNKKFNATIESIKDIALQIIEENPNIPSEASFAIKNIQSDSFLVNFVCSNMNLSIEEKYKILTTNDLHERALMCLKEMNIELQKLSLKNDIQSKVRSDLDKQQREYFLHQQMKTIQEELGGVSYDEEINEMRIRSNKKKWNNEIADHFKKELSKLQRMNPQVAEYSIQRNYLDVYLDLPWNEYSKDNFNLKRAQRILDRDHYGLNDVKKRIIEHMAVLKLRNDMKSPILCFDGPPGVGKTSLGKSIAEALGREYVRISLGGLRDESEIRGHRKTYIGAMPGRIIQSIKKAKTSNPVFVLDEIDKLSVGNQGDPSSAMLEVLDPEQNTSFYDNFIESGYDLSKVMFIATSNNIGNVQPALRDRMEIVSVSGYTIEEKCQIAKKHLLPKQIIEHGLPKDIIKLNMLATEKVIEGYTRESGVRGLEKQIAKIIRNIAKSIALDESFSKEINSIDLEKILGISITKDKYENNEIAGVVTGLAWTQFGGDILFIESALSKGKGNLSITGNLGKVMKESATIALEYIKSNAGKLSIDIDIIANHNIHIHVPEGATPKDGPSAGITMLTSIVSLLTQRRVKNKLAMTGEITLRGKVLPVGGVKEKILAAKRAKIKEIILSKDNEKNVLDIDKNYLKGLTFHYVSSMEEVIELAITKQKVKNYKTF